MGRRLAWAIPDWALIDLGRLCDLPTVQRGLGVERHVAGAHYADSHTAARRFAFKLPDGGECSAVLTLDSPHRALTFDSKNLRESTKLSLRPGATRMEQARETLMSVADPFAREIAAAKGYPAGAPGEVYANPPAGERTLTQYGYALAASKIAIPSGFHPSDVVRRWQRSRWGGDMQRAIDELNVREGSPNFEANRDLLFRHLPACVEPVTLHGGRLHRYRPRAFDRVNGAQSPAVAAGIGSLNGLYAAPGIFSSIDAQRYRAIWGTISALALLGGNRADMAKTSGNSKKDMAEQHTPPRLLRLPRWIRVMTTYGGIGILNGAGRSLVGNAADADLGMDATAYHAMQVELNLRYGTTGVGTAVGVGAMRPLAFDSEEVEREVERLLHAHEPVDRVDDHARRTHQLYRAWVAIYDTRQPATHSAEAIEGLEHVRGLLTKCDESLLRARDLLYKARLRRGRTSERVGAPAIPQILRKNAVPQTVALASTLVPAAWMGYPEMVLLGLPSLVGQALLIAGVSRLRNDILDQNAAQQEELRERQWEVRSAYRAAVHEALDRVIRGEPADLDWDGNLRERPTLRPPVGLYAKYAAIGTPITGAAGIVASLPPSLQTLWFGIVAPAASTPWAFYLERWVMEYLDRRAKYDGELLDDTTEMYRFINSGVELLRDTTEREEAELATFLGDLEAQLMLPPEAMEHPGFSQLWPTIVEDGSWLLRHRFLQLIAEENPYALRFLHEGAGGGEPEQVVQKLKAFVEAEVKTVASANLLLREMDEYLPDDLATRNLLGETRSLDVTNPSHRTLARELSLLPNVDGQARLPAAAWEKAAELGVVQDGMLVPEMASLLRHAGYLVADDVIRAAAHTGSVLPGEIERRPVTPQGLRQRLVATLVQPTDVDAPLDLDRDGRREEYLVSLLTRLKGQRRFDGEIPGPCQISERLMDASLARVTEVLAAKQDEVGFDSLAEALTIASQPDFRHHETDADASVALGLVHERVHQVLADPRRQVSERWDEDGSRLVAVSPGRFSFDEPDPRVPVCIFKVSWAKVGTQLSIKEVYWPPDPKEALQRNRRIARSLRFQTRLRERLGSRTR